MGSEGQAMVTFERPQAAQGSLRARMLRVLEAALIAADPVEAIRRAVQRDGDLLRVDGRVYDLREFRRVLVIGGGKAGGAMAQAVEDLLGDRITAGRVIVKTDHLAPTQLIRLTEAGHPVPDQAGVDGTRAMVELLRDTVSDDLVICLISGGGSALMTLPVEGVSLDDIRAVTGALLASGAPIQAINAVRKHLSQVNGGQLARLAAPAAVIALILSDVVGSPLDVIASGPTVADPTTFADAQAIVARYGIADDLPAAVREHLAAGAAGRVPDTVKAGDPALARVQNVIVADNARAVEAAQAEAEALGFHTLLLSTYVEGEAREVARVVAALAKEIAVADRPVPRPACLLMGGETTVTLRPGHGRGGRNQELALAAALAIDGWAGVEIASLATDGTDGPTDSAGGLVNGSTVARGWALGRSALAALDGQDAYSYLEAVGDLMVTGPTRTNVNDLIAVMVDR